jgi:hypothetical protein
MWLQSEIVPNPSDVVRENPVCALTLQKDRGLVSGRASSRSKPVGGRLKRLPKGHVWLVERLDRGSSSCGKAASPDLWEGGGRPRPHRTAWYLKTGHASLHYGKRRKITHATNTVPLGATAAGFRTTKPGELNMQVLNHRRVAFIFFPHLSETTPLDTMPFAVHILRKLVSAQYEIDVFHLGEANSSFGQYFVSDNVRYKRVKLHATTNKTKFVELTLRFARCMHYKCVFSVGLIGSYVGGLVSALSRCPFVLLNDEFPSMYEPPNMYGYSGWLSLERWAASRADAIIVPSDDRHIELRKELRLETDTLFATIRNTPEIELPLENIDWHTRLGIPSDKKIFIHAGSIADWAQVPEILASISYWPAGAVALLHNSRGRDELARYRKQLSHLDNQDRVFWSSDLLSNNMVNSLVNYCTGSFALYRNCGPNFEQIGTSSGKLMRSIVCGTPVIASKFDSLNFVTREGLGRQVMHPSEIPTAVEHLMRNIARYRKQCEMFANYEETLREEACNMIMQRIESSPKRRSDGPFSPRREVNAPYANS